jgi:predicted nucleotidyltransferase
VPPPRSDFISLLHTLLEYKVDFIVVGGVCAVLHGAPISTFDLDLVHSRTSENVSRLLQALSALGAYYRGRGTQSLSPAASHLLSPGHQLLMTNAGPLDLLGEIGKERDYQSLLEHVQKVKVGSHLEIQLLNLETLISTKEEAAREKDIAALPVLRRTLEELKKQKGDSADSCGNESHGESAN